MGRTKRLRGYRTHGRGKKAGRGKGRRGGFGMSGLHKHKFKWMIKYDPEHFGRHGFVRHAARTAEPKAVNLFELQERMEEFIKSGVAEKKGSIVEVDLSKAGIDKLLGKGNVKVPFKIIVGGASQSAISKVSEAGGEVVLRD